jgi:hypothetical protein
MISFRSRAFYAYGKAISILWVGSWMPSKTSLDHLEKGKIFCPGLESNHYLLVVLPLA